MPCSEPSSPDSRAESELLVLCLCAAWCRTCDAYREVLSQDSELSVCWVDVEDLADQLPDDELTQFPTLVLAVGGRVVFFGPVLPQLQVLKRLMAQARSLPAVQGCAWNYDDAVRLIGAARAPGQR